MSLPALKCIIEVLSGALSPAQPPPAASAECMEILRGDNRISTLIHQHDLLSQLEEIAGRGPAAEHAGAASTATGAKYEPSEERQETKEKEEVEDDEETRVDHEEKDKKDAKKKKQQQQQENDDDDDDEKEKREEGGDDETKSGVGKSREFRTKGPGSAERRAGGAGGGGTKWSGGRVRVEPRHGEAPPEKATGREWSNGEEPRGQMHGPPGTGDEEEEEERSPHHEDKDDVGDEVARSVGTGVDDDEVEEEDADVEEEVTETPARRGDTRPQRGSHGTSGVERSAAREAHDGRRRPAAEQLLEYLDQIRQRLGQKQQEQQQQQEQQRRRGDYGGRHPDKGEPLAERKSDGEDDDDDGDDEKVEYETRKSEVGGRHGHDEVEDDAREQEEDNDRTDDDDAEGEEQVGGEEVFGDGVGSSHRWAGKAHAEGRPAWGAAHRAAAKGDEVEDAAQGGDGEEGDEEKEQEEVGRGGGKEWGGDKRAQDTQSRKHSTLNSKQLLELKAMEHELVKIAERLGERLG
ncbi:uncharacterized protein LOC144727516 [Lampetra planeri]